MTNKHIDPEVIRQARDHLAAGHWIKGNHTDGWGNYCAVGALGRNIFGYQVRRYVDFLEQFVPTHQALEIFNDSPNTTLADMLTVFDKALAELGSLGD
jgi:hypothetical protein